MDFADQLHGLRRGGIAVRCLDHLEPTDVEPVPLSHGGNLFGRPNKNRDDDAGFCRLDGTAQRGLVAGMCHDCDRRGHLFRARDQSLVFALGWVPYWSDRRDITDLAVKRHDYPRSLQCGVSGVRS